MFCRLVLPVVAALCAATAVIAAQVTSTPDARDPSRVVAIGCITRSPARGAAPASRQTYLLTDKRSTPPTVYRLAGEGIDWDFHAGHFVEVRGTATMARTGPHGLRVATLIYISRTCPKQ